MEASRLYGSFCVQLYATQEQPLTSREICSYPLVHPSRPFITCLLPEPPMTQQTSVLISESRLRTPSALGLIMSFPGRQLRVSPRRCRRRLLLLLLLLLLLPFVAAGRRRVFFILLFLILLLVVVVLCGKSLKRRYLKLQDSLIVSKSGLRACQRSSIN